MNACMYVTSIYLSSSTNNKTQQKRCITNWFWKRRSEELETWGDILHCVDGLGLSGRTEAMNSVLGNKTSDDELRCGCVIFLYI